MAFGETLARGLDRLGIGLEPAAHRAIEDHVRLLLVWTSAINLTAIREPSAVAREHVLDSLAALSVLRAGRIDAFVDLGSGGGFPGLPLALALPARRSLLVDSVGKKARFLEVVIAVLEADRMKGDGAAGSGLAGRSTAGPGTAASGTAAGSGLAGRSTAGPGAAGPGAGASGTVGSRTGASAAGGPVPRASIRVAAERAEALAVRGRERGAWPAVLARAVAPLPELVELAFPLLQRDGILVAWKRLPMADELAAARPALAALGGGPLEVHRTQVDGLEDHVLVVVRKVRDTPAGFPRPPSERRRRPL